MSERDKLVSTQDVIRRLNEIEDNLQKRIAAVEEDVQENSAAIAKAEQDILTAISGSNPPEAVAGKFTLIVGGIPMPGVTVTVPVTLSGGTSTFIETAADGTVVPNVGPVIYASDADGTAGKPLVASIDASGNWKPLGPGVANLSALDQGNGLTDTVALTVTPGAPPPAVKGTFTLIPNATRR